MPELKPNISKDVLIQLVSLSVRFMGFNPSTSRAFLSYIEIKIKLNFYFDTSLWCRKKF